MKLIKRIILWLKSLREKQLKKKRLKAILNNLRDAVSWAEEVLLINEIVDSNNKIANMNWG
jgi:hypothetical protein